MPPVKARPSRVNDSGRNALGRAAMALTAAACTVPFAILAFFVYRYGVNLPHSDQWDLVGLIAKSRRPGIGPGDLFAQHGEQRMFFPRLIMLALAPLTDWNIRAELFVNLMLAGSIFAVLIVLIKKTLAPMGAWAGIPAAVLSLLIFSPVQWEDWFWGWQISWFLPLFCLAGATAILALWPERRPAWIGLTLATGAALIGQYSLLSGTLIWLVCLPIFAFRKHIRRYWIPWAAAGIVSTFAYLHNYMSPASMEGFRMPPSLLLTDPKRPLAYFLYFLGRPVLDEKPSYAVGALFVAAFFAASGFLLAARRERLEAAAPWLAIGSYSILAAILTTFGRLNIGLQFAGSSRYTTVGILLMVSALALISIACLPQPAAGRPARLEGSAVSPGPEVGGRIDKTSDDRLRIRVLVGVWILVAAMFVLDYSSEVETMKIWHNQRLEAKSCLVNARSAREPCLSNAYPVPEALFERVGYLKRIGWGGFERSTPAASSK